MEMLGEGAGMQSGMVACCQLGRKEYPTNSVTFFGAFLNALQHSLERFRQTVGLVRR